MPLAALFAALPETADTSRVCDEILMTVIAILSSSMKNEYVRGGRAHFTELVLGCIEADYCNHTLGIWYENHTLRSTALIDNILAKLCQIKSCQMFAEFLPQSK